MFEPNECRIKLSLDSTSTLFARLVGVWLAITIIILHANPLISVDEATPASPHSGLHDTLGDVRRGIALPWTCPPVLRFSAVDTLRNDMLHYYNIVVATRETRMRIGARLDTVSLYSCTRTGAICPRPQNVKCLRQTVRDRMRPKHMHVYRSVIYLECRPARPYHPSLCYSSDVILAI